MTSRLGIAVLGCGYWGSHYVRIFNQIPESSVVAVCDRRPERLHQLAGQLGDTCLTTDVDDVLHRSDVDAVVIATEATAHYAVARRCLRAGKHVLVEKPIATTVAESDELIAIADARNLILMVGHTFLYNPAVRTVKEYLRRGEVGQVYYLYARRTNMGPIRHDVDALWDLAPHDISIFNYLLDRTPIWVSAVGAKVLRNGREDVGFIALGYGDNVVGHIHVSWADPQKVREVVVVGSERRIVFDDLRTMEPVRIFEKGIRAGDEHGTSESTRYVLHDGAIISPRIEPSEPLRNQCQHFLDCIARRCSPLSSGREGRDVVRVLAAIDESVARRGEPIELDKGEVHVFSDDVARNGLRAVR